MKNVIRKAEYLETDGRFKLVVQTRAPVFDAALRTLAAKATVEMLPERR